MDDGLYLPIPGHLLFSHPEIFSHGLDEFLTNTTACAHTHTYNVPPSVATHNTHTCLHTQARLIASGEDDVEQEDQLRNPRKPLGNREAVRKYREKKKAHAAFLEEEVRKLRAANQQLLRGHAALEAEVVRLSSLLLDVRGKIDAELGGILLHAEPPAPGFGTDVQEAAVREDCEIDESGIVSEELGAPEVADSVDAVASFNELCCLIG
uniref:Uncharacterized protein n=2 Tax=Avena sativa TaxID=4498 RepID=A0ACD5WG27_AVESA